MRLHVEHRPIPTGQCHQFVVRAKFNHAAVFKNTDTIGVANRGEAMGDQDGRAVPGRSEHALKDFRFPANIELRRWLIEQHDARAKTDSS